jgi:tetratricopeptide (TPR) repeat protein
MCGASAFPGVQSLAHVLLANDWVDALAIESSRDEAVKSGKRHGEVLVARGLLSKDQLRTALAAQHTTNLLTLLGLTQGKYDWRGWEPPPPWAREVVVDPVRCLVDALEQDQHEPRRAKVLSWLGEHPVRFSMDWPDLESRIALGEADRRATALLSLPRPLKEFVRASNLEPTRAEAVLVALLLAGAVEPQPGVKAEPVPAPSAPPPRKTAPAAPAVPAPPPPAPPAREPVTAPRDGDFDLQPAPPSRQKRMEEREAIARLDALSLDEVPPAKPAEEKEPELELDRPAPAQGTEDERAREMRKKMVARGMRNLGTLPSRAEMENSVAVTPKYPAPPGRGVAAPRAAAGEMSVEDQRYADDVRSRVRLAPGQSAYARLGVETNASSETIRNAYLDAAKRFHPDRAAGPALSSLQAELQTLFALLKEAYEAIATPDARKKYDAAVKSKSPDGLRREEASIALKMADVLMKKRDFGEALIKLRKSVELDPTGDALAALAWALVADPKSSPAAKEEAAGVINKALRAPGVTARTYYVAGVLWRTKDPESAVDAFRKALEIDPRHQDAALELRLIEQRRNKPAARKSGGVLSGLLFGKRKG